MSTLLLRSLRSFPSVPSSLSRGFLRPQSRITQTKRLSSSYDPHQFFRNYKVGKAVLWTTIGINVGVFAYWRYAYNQSRGSMADILSGSLKPNSSRLWPINFLNSNFLLNVDDVAQRPWTVITSAFSHQDIGHLAGNMFSLYAFGTVLLSAGVTPVTFSSILLGSAVAGSLGFLYHSSTKQRITDGFYRRSVNGLGASGAVMGVGTAAALLQPRASMLVLGVIPVPLFILVGGYVYYDSYYMDDPTSMVGHAAHLGGAAFGTAAYLLLLRRYGGIFGRRW